MGETIRIDPNGFGGPAAQKRVQESAQTAGTETSTARGQADLPFIRPKAAAELTNAQLKTLKDLQENASESGGGADQCAAQDAEGSSGERAR